MSHERMRQIKFQYLIPSSCSMLSDASSVVLRDQRNHDWGKGHLNQKYWVSLLPSHSGMVELSAARGQEAQGREV